MPPLDRLTGLAQRSLPVIRRAAGWALTNARQVAVAARERVRESRAASPPPPTSTSNGASRPRATPPAPPAPAPSVATTPGADADAGHVEREAVLVAESADEQAADGAGAEVHVAEPWPGYGEMTAADIIDRLAVADAGILAVVRLYESSHSKRVTVLREADRLLAAADTGG